MPDVPGPANKEPAEGAVEVIDRELRRSDNQDKSKQAERGGEAHAYAAKPAGPALSPGDEAAPGTPGTGEDICPACLGTGMLHNGPCPNCQGSGRITKAIGGA